MRAIVRRLAAMLIATALPLLAHGAADNYQGLWWNAPAESESGWGMSIAHQGDAMMATWFTYDDMGQPMWLVIVAGRSADGFAGTVYQASLATGPYLVGLPFDPARVTRTPVGRASLSFTDASNGTLQYSVRGVERTKAITRQVFGPVPACSYAAQPQLANASNYTDLWWAAHGTESGWGISLAHEGDTIFAAWFTYDKLGAPRWIVATAPRVAANVYSGTAIRATGPAFAAPLFDPARVARTAVGSATFTFMNGNAAVLTAIVDGATTTTALTRELFATPAGTMCRNASTSTIQGKVFAPGPVAATVCADTNGNGACDVGEPHTTSAGDGTYALDAGPDYAGAIVAETGDGYRMATPGIDYSTNVTPYTTLVALTGEPEFAIAEMMVRNELGLPARFAIRLDAPPAEGSLAQSVARSVVVALKAASGAPVAAGALPQVIAAFPPALTELPQLRITTKDGAPIVSKDDYVDATYVLVNPAASTRSVNLNGRIRGRGNTTWTQPKKPYKVQFTNDAALAALPDVLGMPRSRYWALLADYLDRSVMRNQLAFMLGNSSLFAEGLKFTPQTARVEVWLNGEYEGLYTLVQEIRVDADRLDIHKIGASEVDGGYLVEVDAPLDCVGALQHETPQDVRLCLKTPDENSATGAQVGWIKAYIDNAERSLYDRGTTDSLNLTSYADWYLLNEFMRNYDAPFYSSDYMWKDSAAAAIPGDRLLNMGPVWDFDMSAGDMKYADNWRPQGCWVNQRRPPNPGAPDGTYISNWYTALSANPAFVRLATARWKDKSAALRRLTDQSIAAFSRRIEAAAGRNIARWPELGNQNWFEEFTLPAWRDTVNYLRDFLDQRGAWMDTALDSPSSFALMCK